MCLAFLGLWPSGLGNYLRMQYIGSSNPPLGISTASLVSEYIPFSSSLVNVKLTLMNLVFSHKRYLSFSENIIFHSSVHITLIPFSLPSGCWRKKSNHFANYLTTQFPCICVWTGTIIFDLLSALLPPIIMELFYFTLCACHT